MGDAALEYLCNGDGPPVDRRRRGIVGAMFGSFLGLGFSVPGAALGLWAAGIVAWLGVPNAVARPPQRFKVGLPSNYPVGVVETKYQEKWGVWVVHGTYRGRRHIYALSSVCTHMGCVTTWQAGQRQFKCPRHGSGFDQTGINVAGPAPRPLERYAICLGDDGQLEVDRDRIFQEELGQWADPASFVEAWGVRGGA